MNIPEPAENTIVVVNSVRSLLLSVFLALLSFFIMMNAISSNNQQKSEQTFKSLNKEFNQKDIGKKLLLYPKNQYDNIEPEKIGKDFKDAITDFMAGNKNIDANLSETPALYILKINSLSFFALNSNDPRSNAQDFLLSLNKFISANAKAAEAKANVIIFNDDNEIQSNLRLLRIHDVVAYQNPNNINFSVINNDSIKKQIYVIFDKNEF